MKSGILPPLLTTWFLKVNVLNVLLFAMISVGNTYNVNTIFNKLYCLFVFLVSNWHNLLEYSFI